MTLKIQLDASGDEINVDRLAMPQ